MFLTFLFISLAKSTSYRFWGGPIALLGFVHFLNLFNQKGTPPTKVVYDDFDRHSCIGKHEGTDLTGNHK